MNFYEPTEVIDISNLERHIISINVKAEGDRDKQADLIQNLIERELLNRKQIVSILEICKYLKFDDPYGSDTYITKAIFSLEEYRIAALKLRESISTTQVALARKAILSIPSIYHQRLLCAYEEVVGGGFSIEEADYRVFALILRDLAEAYYSIGEES